MKIEISEGKILRMAEAIKALRKLSDLEAVGNRYPSVKRCGQNGSDGCLDHVDGFYQYRADMVDLVDAYEVAVRNASKAVLDGVRQRLTAIANGEERS